MRIVGLDLSLARTGIAVITPEHIEAWCRETDSSKCLQERIGLMAAAVQSRVVTPGTHVFIENHSFGSFGAGKTQLAELAGVVKVGLWERRIPFALVAPNTLKKWVLGFGGKSDKSMILHRIALKTGFEPLNDDEADALALADFGWHVLNPESPRRELLQYEKDTIAAFLSPKVKKPRKRKAD